jgi:hypothetical protein
MTETHCFRKVGSNPPICGIHKVLLARKDLPTEILGAGSKYGGLAFFVCPVSGEVLVNEAADA